jgi:hypothetical protein
MSALGFVINRESLLTTWALVVIKSARSRIVRNSGVTFATDLSGESFGSHLLLPRQGSSEVTTCVR